MNSTIDSDLEKTACFFCPSLNSNSPIKSPYKLLFPKKVKRNIAIKRRNSQIELPRLTTEVESTREKRTFSTKLQTIPSSGNEVLKPIMRRHNSQEDFQSPMKVSFSNFVNLRQKLISRGGKSFLQCKPQQKLVTRIFGE